MDILLEDFIKGLLIFLRVAAVLLTMPVFGNITYPVLPKLGLSLILTYLFIFSIPDFAFNYYDGLLPLAIYGIKEVLTGLLIGFAMNFIFYGMTFAGLLIGNEMGLSMATMFDPYSENQNNIIGTLISMLAMIVFLLIDGHHFIIQAVSASFKLIPLGSYTVNGSLIELLIKYSAGIFLVAVKISAPLIVSFFLLNVASGIISRVIPQMQILFVIFPLKIGLGFVLLAMVMPIYVKVIKSLLTNYEKEIYELILVMSK